jgi:hypothetical protein
MHDSKALCLVRRQNITSDGRVAQVLVLAIYAVAQSMRSWRSDDRSSPLAIPCIVCWDMGFRRMFGGVGMCIHPTSKSGGADLP